MQTDYILSQEENCNEFLNNRQNAKIKFFQQENSQLQEDIEDLQKVLALNKEALKLAYQQIDVQKKNIRKQQLQLSQARSINATSDVTNNESETIIIQENNDLESKQMCFHLMNENKHIQQQVVKLKLERNQAQSRALISEQISEEAQAFHQEIIAEYEEKIQDLRRNIHDKEFIIQEFGQQNVQKESSGTFYKIKEIVDPTEQSMKLHKELENFREIIIKLTRENFNLNQQNMVYQDFNRVIYIYKDQKDLVKQIQKIRTVIYNPVNFQQMKSFLNGDIRLVDDHLDIHNYFYTEYFQDELERERAFEKYKKNMNINIPPFIPRERLSSNKQVITRKQLEQLENSVQNSLMLVSKEHVNNNILLDQIGELQRYNNQLIETNDILVQSNTTSREKQQHQQRELELYKCYYYKYMEFIKNRRKNNQSTQQQYLPMEFLPLGKKQEKNFQQRSDLIQIRENNDILNISNKFSNNLVYIDDEKIIPEEDQKQETEVNVSVLEDRVDSQEENNQEGLVLDQPNIIDDDNLDKDQCKIYLLNLAKDLYVNYQLNNKGITKKVLKKIEISGQKQGINNLFRNRRTLSDPLDYICDQSNIQKIQQQQRKQVHQQNIQQLNILKIVSDEKEPQAQNEFFNELSIIGYRQQSRALKNPRKRISIEGDVSFMSYGDADFQNQFFK